MNNIELIISYSVSGLILLLAVVLLIGKGSFLIAGYNTASREEREKYDPLKLCRVVGSGLLLISLILTMFTYFEFDAPKHIAWLMPWGYIGIIILMIILANTICKKKH